MQANPQGIAIFDWLPADRERATSVDLAPGVYCAPGSPKLEPNGKSGETIVRVVRESLLRGKVVTPDGRPAGRILVTARGKPLQQASDIFNAGGSARTAGDGTYKIMVPSDHSYMVGVFDQNWAAKSLTGLTARENDPCDVPVLHLFKGTVIRSRLTIGPERKPLAGQTILLSEAAALMPDGETGTARAATGSIYRELIADKQGRFAFRVGTGDYELIVFPEIRDREVDGDLGRFNQKVTSEEIIDRELHLAGRNAAAGDRITGVVRERTRSGSNPLAGAVVEPLALVQSSRAVTDAQGRFKLARADGPTSLTTGRDGKQGLYARSRDGSRAAFASIIPDQRRGRDRAGGGGTRHGPSRRRRRQASGRPQRRA